MTSYTPTKYVYYRSFRSYLPGIAQYVCVCGGECVCVCVYVCVCVRMRV